MSEPKYYRFSLENGLEGTAEFVPATTSYAIAFDLDLRHRLEGNYMEPTLRLSREARDVDDNEYMRRILRNGGIRYREKWTLKEMAIPLAAPGSYHPRIWRQSSGPSSRELYGNSFLGNLVAYWNLERDLQSILRTIEPDPANDFSYGHSLRDILILACTEVEQLLKQVLRANGYAPSGGRWSTNDYVKTIPALWLRDWEISFSDFPDYPPLSPFKSWNAAQPTASLLWYDSYNATKHDRDGAFKKANLNTAISAVAAVLVLLASQFGVGLSRHTFIDDNIRLLRVTEKPNFRPGHQYVPLTTGWVAANHTF